MCSPHRQLPVCQAVSNPPATTNQEMPGVKCPTCESRGVVNWVLEGRKCGYCGTPCGIDD
ncbi:hypothetical protein QBC42DRAFT_263946 [Cladorrhinum samala]|uniref:Uncharacterized protein n=1 Tax=Cladorrhinum samala TaxID=585594 RepID=A0AAV9HXC6_9PEZI|nr:hypothetical protein QBC42DRAFT_263946 [Cladorrhinum samala]